MYISCSCRKQKFNDFAQINISINIIIICLMIIQRISNSNRIP